MSTTSPSLTPLDCVLDGLMRRYQQRVPDVRAVIQCLIDEGLIRTAADIENDHIAFRTLGVPPLGIASLEKVFLHYGYVRRDAYHFPGKKLDAFWYAPPLPKYPRIFISELRVDDVSATAQQIVRSYMAGGRASDPVDALPAGRRRCSGRLSAPAAVADAHLARLPAARWRKRVRRLGHL